MVAATYKKQFSIYEKMMMVWMNIQTIGDGLAVCNSTLIQRKSNWQSILTQLKSGTANGWFI